MFALHAFTLSHIAAAAPFARPLKRTHMFSAAVIGTMLPDAELLFPDNLSREMTHSVQGLATFVLPVGLILWWLFQRLTKPALLEVLPDAWYAPFRAKHESPNLAKLASWILATLVLVAGAASHLLWDAFTHEDGAVVLLLPVLMCKVTIGGQALERYQWLQHLSTLIGLAVLAPVILCWIRTTPRCYVGAQERLFGVRERVLWTLLYLSIPAAYFLRCALQILIVQRCRCCQWRHSVRSQSWDSARARSRCSWSVR